MKIFFSVGEPSGDLHGANLINELQTRDPTIQCVGFGGPRMRDAGCDLHFDLTTLAVMFFTEVVTKLPKFFKLKKQARKYFETEKPDAVILIDFPGFNWHIARAAKKEGIPVFYYGVPQMWAWAPWRIKKLRRSVDHVLCKLPFEPDWFEKRGCQAHDVGHPYFDELEQRKLDHEFLARQKGSSCPRLTLLPGSRDHEVERNISILLDAAEQSSKQIRDLQIDVACFNDSQAKKVEQELAGRRLKAAIHVGRTPELISAATFCIACSGSVSLELMYHQKPTVIVYRVSKFKKFMAGLLFRARYITLVNLMQAENIERIGGLYEPDHPAAEPCPFPEYLTTQNCSASVSRWIVRWHRSAEEYQSRVEQLGELNRKYAKSGATARAADQILKCLVDADSLTGPTIQETARQRRVA